MQHIREQQHRSPYRQLATELLIDGVIMFFVMYAMVSRASYVYLNSNNLYMTLAMIAPMALMMLIAMRHMFLKRILNWVLYAAFSLVFLASFYAIRTQAAVEDEQFLRAMIPHHSGAILMCQNAKIVDSEVKALCDGIIESQQREIDQMQAILRRLQ